MNLDSATALINLKLTEGSLQDNDAANDIIAATTIVTLEDLNDSGDDVGTLANPIHTSVADLTVFTSAGSQHGNQFLREANGLTSLNLNSATALINVKLTEGSLQDSDAANDIIANTAVVTLEDINDSGDDVGTLVNPIHTSLNDLTVFTSAGGQHGNQFLSEANGLIALNLDSATALIDLKLTEGSLQDSDAANDIIAATTIVTLQDTNDSGDAFGMLANPIHTSVADLTIFTNSGSQHGNQFVRESNSLTALNLESATALIDLKLTEGSLQDSDGTNDIIASSAIVTLEDADDSGDNLGSLANPIHTSVANLTVFTKSGSEHGNQFLREANGLVAVNLDAATALVDLRLTEGSLQDSDAANDIIATTTIVTLEDTNDSGDDVGTLANPIHTSVGDLTVFTNFGNQHGRQFLRESNGLAALNLHADTALIDLKLTEGFLLDSDESDDITVTTAVVTLEDANDSGDNLGTLSNPIHTSVGDLTVFTSADRLHGAQYLREKDGITALLLDAGTSLIDLKLSNGELQDADTANDIIADKAIVALDDINDSGDSVGTANALLNTSVSDLTVFTDSGLVHGNQFIRESNGLSAFKLDAGAGSIRIVLTEGALLDLDSSVDAAASTLVAVLEDANDSGDDAGTMNNFLLVEVSDLTVNTAAGLIHGDQYIREVDNLSNLNLDAGRADVYLTAGGRILDADGDIDLRAMSATLIFSDLVGNEQSIQTAVDELRIRSVGGGSVHISEENQLRLTSISLTSGSLFLHSRGTLTVAADGIEVLGGSVELTTLNTDADLFVEADIRVTQDVQLISGRNLVIGTSTSGNSIRAVEVPASVQAVRMDGGLQYLRLDTVAGLFAGQVVEIQELTGVSAQMVSTTPYQIVSVNAATNEVVLDRAVTGYSNGFVAFRAMRQQTISLEAVGNIRFRNGTVISTDDLPQNSYQRLPVLPSGESQQIQDRILVTADRLNLSSPEDAVAVRDNRRTAADLRDPQSGIQRGLVDFGDRVELRTDGGVARVFAARPMIPEASPGTAFFEDLSDPIPTILEPGKSNDYIAVVNLDIGNPGEEGLRFDVDWRDPNTGILDFPSLRIESRYFDFGKHEITHRYSVDDFTKFYQEARLRDLILDFSVSHHESISVIGDAVIQTNAAHVLAQRPDPQNGGVFRVGDQISSTDRIATGEFNTTDRINPQIERSLKALASSEESDADFHFDGGLLLLRIPSMPFAPIDMPRPEFTPLPISTETPVLLPTNPVQIEAVEVEESIPEAAYQPTEGAFILRQTGWPKADEIEVMDPEEFNDLDRSKKGINALSHPDPEQLLNPEELREWLRQTRPLPDGSDYELLIRTTRRLPSGAEVVLERLLLRFDVREGEPFPAADETLPAPLPTPELMEIPEPAPAAENETTAIEGEQDEQGVLDRSEIQIEAKPAAGSRVSAESRYEPEGTDSYDAAELSGRLRPAAFAIPGVAGMLVSRVLNNSTGTKLPTAATLRAAVTKTLQGRKVSEDSGRFGN